jgi:hypothetical protein
MQPNGPLWIDRVRGSAMVGSLLAWPDFVGSRAAPYIQNADIHAFNLSIVDILIGAHMHSVMVLSAETQ